jgi:release factor glutamine methyltransferase
VTVLEVIQKSTAFLEKKGVASARLQSELLLAGVLARPRLQLYLDFEKKLADAELERMREWVKRRGNREPLQHLLGKVAFCDFEVAVGPQALIPRPETELLAEKAWGYLTGLNAEKPCALDLGTGTGCLAIGLALKCPAARIVAVDISGDALELARENARRNGVAERISFQPGDGFAALDGAERFNLIVTNPPYIASGEIAELAPEVRDHDPRLALDGGLDGLDFYRRLAVEAAAWLAPEGRLMAEFGDGQGPDITTIFSAQNWVVETVERDYSNKERLIVLRMGD